MFFTQRKMERRRGQRLIFVERRKGRAWMYGEIAFFVVLVFYLLKLLK